MNTGKVMEGVMDGSIGGDECHFLGRIEQKSDSLWVVTHINCQSCLPEYFDNWHQATLFLVKLDSYR